MSSPPDPAHLDEAAEHDARRRRVVLAFGVWATTAVVLGAGAGVLNTVATEGTGSPETKVLGAFFAEVARVVGGAAVVGGAVGGLASLVPNRSTWAIPVGFSVAIALSITLSWLILWIAFG